MTMRAIATALLAAAVALGHGRPANAASVDPMLAPVLSGQATPSALGLTPLGGATGAAAEQDSLFSVSVRVTGSLDELRALGIPFGGALGDVATAEVTAAQLRILAAHPAVLSISASRPLALNINASVPDTGVITDPNTLVTQPTVPNPFRRHDNGAWSDTSYTGRGVLIGIIDTGVDLAHDDFLKRDGATRVLAVWDQSSSVGRPPRGFSYGAECTSEQIDTRDCPQVDRDGHGTHVAGIAAGDGSATGRDQPIFQYIGMAPEADLLVVKLRSQTTTRVIDALDYLHRKAVALEKPIAVNLSLGSPLGPHDGTTDLERAIDEFTARGIVLSDQARTLGAVVVVSGGNNGQYVPPSPNPSDPTLTPAPVPLHAVGCFQAATACPPGITALSAGAPTAVSFNVPGDSSPRPDTTSVTLDVWYPGTSTLGVSVQHATPGCGAGPASLAGSGFVSVTTPCGTIVISAADTQNSNGDRNTQVVITHATRITPGVWTLTIIPDSIPATTRFDVWSDASPSENRIGFNSLPSAATTIDFPASASGAIAVVPYITKLSWTSLVPGCCQLDPALGKINGLATYASRGPLRQCSLCAVPPPKPELAAPGLAIMSSFSSRISGTSLLDFQTDPDRSHYILSGSSMAAPHVTGAAAILLQINPLLTAQEVKNYLINNAVPPAGNVTPPPTLPDTQWGAGRLAMPAAIAALRATGSDRVPSSPDGLRVTSVHSRRVALAWDRSADLDLQTFQVLRRAEGDAVAIPLLPFLNPTVTTFEDPPNANSVPPENDTVYYYSVQAVDIAGQASVLTPSAEIRAVPNAGEGSVGFCFIATAAYGSAWHPHVASLRRFRDERLRPFAAGRAAIAVYETVSPPIAAFIAPHPTLRAITRGALTPVVFAVEYPRTALAWISVFLLGTATIVRRRRSA
ncbi:MAG: S8 family serine peptidase [Nitrospirota bacterium]